MSGGHFDYNQYKIRQISESIASVIENNGRKKTEEEIKEESYWSADQTWFKNHPEDLYFYKYPDEIIEKFKEGLEILKKAEVYAQRIDWYLSGDDSEESFLERLEEDLQKL